jgi:hypothetical protein
MGPSSQAPSNHEAERQHTLPPALTFIRSMIPPMGSPPPLPLLPPLSADRCPRRAVRSVQWSYPYSPFACLVVAGTIAAAMVSAACGGV